MTELMVADVKDLQRAIFVKASTYLKQFHFDPPTSAPPPTIEWHRGEDDIIKPLPLTDENDYSATIPITTTSVTEYLSKLKPNILMTPTSRTANTRQDFKHLTASSCLAMIITVPRPRRGRQRRGGSTLIGVEGQTYDEPLRVFLYKHGEAGTEGDESQRRARYQPKWTEIECINAINEHHSTLIASLSPQMSSVFVSEYASYLLACRTKNEQERAISRIPARIDSLIARIRSMITDAVGVERRRHMDTCHIVFTVSKRHADTLRTIFTPLIEQREIQLERQLEIQHSQVRAQQDLISSRLEPARPEILPVPIAPEQPLMSVAGSETASVTRLGNESGLQSGQTPGSVTTSGG